MLYRIKKFCSHKYYLFYYTVNIADFQGLLPVAFLNFWLLLCFVKNLFFPLLYIQKAGNEPSRLHSAAFLLPEKRKGGLVYGIQNYAKATGKNQNPCAQDLL